MFVAGSEGVKDPDITEEEIVCVHGSFRYLAKPLRGAIPSMLVGI